MLKKGQPGSGVFGRAQQGEGAPRFLDGFADAVGQPEHADANAVEAHPVRGVVLAEDPRTLAVESGEAGDRVALAGVLPGHGLREVERQAREAQRFRACQAFFGACEGVGTQVVGLGRDFGHEHLQLLRFGLGLGAHSLELGGTAGEEVGRARDLQALAHRFEARGLRAALAEGVGRGVEHEHELGRVHGAAGLLGCRHVALPGALPFGTGQPVPGDDRRLAACGLELFGDEAVQAFGDRGRDVAANGAGDDVVHELAAIQHLAPFELAQRLGELGERARQGAAGEVDAERLGRHRRQLGDVAGGGREQGEAAFHDGLDARRNRPFVVGAAELAEGGDELDRFEQESRVAADASSQPGRLLRRVEAGQGQASQQLLDLALGERPERHAHQSACRFERRQQRLGRRAELVVAAAEGQARGQRLGRGLAALHEGLQGLDTGAVGELQVVEDEGGAAPVDAGAQQRRHRLERLRALVRGAQRLGLGPAAGVGDLRQEAHRRIDRGALERRCEALDGHQQQPAQRGVREHAVARPRARDGTGTDGGGELAQQPALADAALAADADRIAHAPGRDQRVHESGAADQARRPQHGDGNRDDRSRDGRGVGLENGLAEALGRGRGRHAVETAQHGAATIPDVDGGGAVAAQVEDLHQHPVGLFRFAVEGEQLVGLLQRLVELAALGRRPHRHQQRLAPRAALRLALGRDPFGELAAVVVGEPFEPLRAGGGGLDLDLAGEREHRALARHHRGPGDLVQLGQALAQVAAGAGLGHAGPEQAGQARARRRAVGAEPGDQRGLLAVERRVADASAGEDLSRGVEADVHRRRRRHEGGGRAEEAGGKGAEYAARNSAQAPVTRC